MVISPISSELALKPGIMSGSKVFFEFSSLAAASPRIWAIILSSKNSWFGVVLECRLDVGFRLGTALLGGVALLRGSSAAVPICWLSLRGMAFVPRRVDSPW